MPLESESEEVEPEEEPLLLKNGAYVVVKYTSKRSSAMFVGQVTALNRKEDLVTVTFLKRNGVIPCQIIKESAVISQIFVKLWEPIGTHEKRQELKYFC